jgi:hypothetical protein
MTDNFALSFLDMKCIEPTTLLAHNFLILISLPYQPKNNSKNVTSYMIKIYFKYITYETRLQPGHSMKWYAVFPKAFFTLKLLYSLMVHA